jgi:radical SAM protein with 4Fe4S-binding SPASM domain
MQAVPDRVQLSSPLTPGNILTHRGKTAWDPGLRRLTVETASQCWSYAAQIRLPEPPPHLSYAQYLIRIKVRTLVGEVGIAVLGADLSELKGEVIVPASGTPRHIELSVADLRASGGVLVRNGSQQQRPSQAEIDSIEVFGLPELNFSLTEVIEGFVAACKSAPGADIVVFPALTVNVAPCTIRMVRIGSGEPLGGQAVRQIAKTAELSGYAITAATKVHGTVLAVRQSRVADLPGNPEQWFGALLEYSEPRYQEAVSAQYRDLLPTLEQSMRAELADVLRPAQESVIFELANACNLACPFCPRNGRKIKDGLMKAEDAKRIVTDIATASSQRFIFYPHYLGETMIHPAIFDVIDHALSFSNVEVHCISNGILLDERRREELVKRPIVNYNFSIHECDQIGQQGVSPEQALSSRNVLAFLRRLDEVSKRESTHVSVSMVPSSFQDPTISVFRDYWLGVANQVIFYACVALDRTIAEPETIKPSVRLPCTAPWRAPVVAYDGNVLPCCWDYEHSMVMGNVFEQKFEEIWTGERFVSLRKAILDNDYSQYPTCASCEKWQQWVPGPPQVRLPKYYFTSNSTYRAYGSLDLDKELLNRRLATLPVTPQWKHLPIYRKPKNYAENPPAPSATAAIATQHQTAARAGKALPWYSLRRLLRSTTRR